MWQVKKSTAFNGVACQVVQTEPHQAEGIARKGSAFCNEIPNFSSMFMTPPSIFQSKLLIREPNIKCNILMAKGNPGHIRRPAPKGMSSKFLPLTSISNPKNLSGVKHSGFSQTSGSLPIAQALTSTCEPSGILKPWISTSAPALRGSNRGSGGCIRTVSLTIACK
ncbi:hypothetical protein QQP08_013013 [Theobroma cacao]|nr:hypothetical protein QQP08_013013 [Theobroma cacao]